MADETPNTQDTTKEAEGEEMCCDGSKTAAEHRAESEDGKCRVDK